MAKKITIKEPDSYPEAKIAEVVIPAPKIVMVEEVFNFLNLKMLTDGLFRYNCENIRAIPRDFFMCEGARNYGVRKGQIVMLVDANEVKTVLVG